MTISALTHRQCQLTPAYDDGIKRNMLRKKYVNWKLFEVCFCSIVASVIQLIGIVFYSFSMYQNVYAISVIQFLTQLNENFHTNCVGR